jgi:hypothetical protein
MKLMLAILILWLSVCFAGCAYAQGEEQIMGLNGGQDKVEAHPGMSMPNTTEQMAFAYPSPTSMPDTLTSTFGAYPGMPVPSGTTEQQMAFAYPSGPISMPGIPTSRFAAYPGTPITGGAVNAIYSTIAPPAEQQNILLSYDVLTSPPSAVYYSGSFMPWQTFNTMFPADQPELWVNTASGWSWYATCPIGGWLQDLIYIPYTGDLKLYELYPDGSTEFYSYGWTGPGYKYIWFYADTPGRHITIVTITDRPSNYITVDVF